MGAKTKQVGGGAATPVANNWNQFLNSQLMGGQQQGGPTGASGAPGDPMTPFMNMAQSNAQQPFQQQQGFQGALQGALGGNVQDMSGANAALQNYFKNPTQFSNPYTQQNFQQANTSQLATNFGQGQTGMADLSQFQGPAAQSQFNTQAPINSQFTDMLSSMIRGGPQGQSGFEAAQAQPGVQLGQGMSYQQAYNTLGQDPLMERERMRAVADQRARFGAEGAGALGTGAQYAESNLNAELAARDASQRRAQSMQLMGQDLADRQAAAQTALTGRGQDVQTALSNMQGRLQGAQNLNQFNIANQSNLLGAAGQARGQDLSTALGQMGLGAQQAQFNAGQQNAMTQAQQQAALQNQQLGNQFGVNAAQINQQAGQYNNQNALQGAQMANNFNLANAQNQAQFGLGTNQLNAQQLQNMIGQGLNLNQLGNANTMAALAQLFGGFQQSNALGTPQAQIMQQPSAFGQLANAGLQLGSAYLGGGGSFGGIGRGLASLFGGGGGPQPVNIGGFGSQGGGWTRGIPGGTYTGPSWG